MARGGLGRLRCSWGRLPCRSPGPPARLPGGAEARSASLGSSLCPRGGTALPLPPPQHSSPGTSLYRSPESWLFELRFHNSSTARYLSTPADDLYALGVTACRLLTDEYPRIPEPYRDDHGTWQLKSVLLPPALLSSAYIEPSLRAFTLRLLSVHPEQRGTAAQLAQELEQTLRPFRRTRTRSKVCWGALTAASLAVAVGAWKTRPGKAAKEHSVTQAKPSEADSADTGTTGLGDAATASIPERVPSATTEEAMSENTLPQPVPGQVRPDEKGGCPSKGLVSLNGGCWTESTWETAKCLEFGGQVFKDTCYVPFILREQLDASLGEADAAHLRKIERWGGLAALLGVATCWLAPNPLSAAALSLGRSTRWLLMHYVGHRGYDRVPGSPRGGRAEGGRGQ